MDGDKQTLIRKQFLEKATTLSVAAAAPKQFLSAAASTIPTCFPGVPLIQTNCANSGTFNFNFNFGHAPKITDMTAPVVISPVGTDPTPLKSLPEPHATGAISEKPFKCNLCCQQFARRDTLQCHQRRHTGDRPFPCDTCPLRFARRDTLQCHRRTHTGERRFACDICLQRFARRDTLRCHKRTHSGDKPFACDVCIQRFARRDTLQCHRRTHSGEKPFGCQYCTKRFARTDKLQRHRRTHLRSAGHGNATRVNFSGCPSNCSTAGLSSNAVSPEGDSKNQVTQQKNNNSVALSDTIVTLITNTNNHTTATTTTSIDTNLVTNNNDSSTLTSPDATSTVVTQGDHTASTAANKHLHSNITMLTPYHHPSQLVSASSVVGLSTMYQPATAGFVPPKTDKFPANISNQLWQIF